MNIHNAQDSAVYWYTIWISLAEALSKSAAGLESQPPSPKSKFMENKQVL
jgi:hypothetical protein